MNQINQLWRTQDYRTATLCAHTHPGHRVCVTCYLDLRNNWDANEHKDSHPRHRLLWHCHECNTIQEPITPFAARTACLTHALPGYIPHVQPEEAAAIRAAYPADVDALAALEALARPRIAYAWWAAGGPRRRGDTDEMIQIGREYYAKYTYQAREED